MTRRGIVLTALGIAGAFAILGFNANSIAQSSLRIGGDSANYGVHRLAAGFVPDPKTIAVTSGGSLDVRAMGHGAGCVGYATAQPDVIINYTGQSSLLRFFFQPTGSGDTALVINGPDGSWTCNDDTAGVNPQVDFRSPRPGQYDVWVASYRANANVRGQLKITELSSQTVSP